MVSIRREEIEYHNFDGGPADIVINILFGVAGNALWKGLVILWKAVNQLYTTKESSIEEDKNFIHVIFKTSKNFEIEFILSGSQDIFQIESLVKQIADYLDKEEMQKVDIEKLEYRIPDNDKPRIRMQYNSTTKGWEPVNFVALKKFFEEEMKKLSNRTN